MAVTTKQRVALRLELTRSHLRALRDCLEMEVDRTHDNEGCAGSVQDELENMRFRADLLEVLSQVLAAGKESE